MIFEHLFLLLLLLPPVLWMMCNSHRSANPNRFLLIASGAAVLLLAFCLPGFVLRESRAAAVVLADSLASLSEAELDKTRFHMTPCRQRLG
jgi:hypothetical protein